jgi:hypothetical protein
MYEIYLDVCQLKLIDKGDSFIIEIPSTTYTSVLPRYNKQNSINQKNINANNPIVNPFFINSPKASS